MTDEAAFRNELRSLINADDLKGWHACRMSFADWLEERARTDEALLARQAWAPEGKFHSGRRWECLLPKPVEWWNGRFKERRVKMFGNCVNGSPILHFEAGTLKLLVPFDIQPVTCLHFTHMTGKRGFYWYDTGACPDGFAALFKG